MFIGIASGSGAHEGVLPEIGQWKASVIYHGRGIFWALGRLLFGLNMICVSRGYFHRSGLASSRRLWCNRHFLRQGVFCCFFVQLFGALFLRSSVHHVPRLLDTKLFRAFSVCLHRLIEIFLIETVHLSQSNGLIIGS